MISFDTGHHSYLCIGEPEYFKSGLSLYFTEAGIQSGSPDIWFEEFALFSVDEARSLKERQSRAALGEGSKFFVLTIWKISVEAQNALLKTLEEPTAETKIFLIFPTEEVILPTIKSRSFMIRQAQTSGTPLDVRRLSEADAAKFLSLAPTDRIKWVEKFMASEPTKERVNKLFNDLEFALARDLNPTTAPLLERLGVLKSYSADRSPAMRLILDELALLIP